MIIKEDCKIKTFVNAIKLKADRFVPVSYLFVRHGSSTLKPIINGGETFINFEKFEDAAAYFDLTPFITFSNWSCFKLK